MRLETRAILHVPTSQAAQSRPPKRAWQALCCQQWVAIEVLKDTTHILKAARFILKKAGWEFRVNIPPVAKCLICVAPHTSNWDFIMGELAIHSVGMKAGFLMKSTWFFFPLGPILRSMGGIPVHRTTKAEALLEQRVVGTEAIEAIERLHGDKKNHVTQTVINAFNKRQRLAIAVTPEGTRSRNSHWHKGIVVMAHEVGVPIVLAYFDYKRKVACLDQLFTPTGDIEADMLAIKRYYNDKGDYARYPDHFTTGL